MASSSSTNPAYNVPSFNGRDRLVALHKEITDFLHYQSHVWFAATESLPPHTSSANEQERETIIEFLKEERAHIRTLKRLLEMADDNAPRSTPSSRTRPSTQTSIGENSPGAQRHNGSNRRRHNRNDASATPSASRSNRPIGYNPRADESDYDDNETPDITDLYGDEVYNNID